MKEKKFAARNLSMLIDFYELTMANGYFQSGRKETIAVFDMFFRKIPDNGGFAIFAGLEQLIDYMKNLEFDEEDIAYLRGRGVFCEEFLDYLAIFHFECDVWAVPEGTPVFPNEPMVIVRGPVSAGAAAGNHAAAHHQPSVAHCHQGQPHCPAQPMGVR